MNNEKLSGVARNRELKQIAANATSRFNDLLYMVVAFKLFSKKEK
jgi:hypothetical protein